MKPFYWILIGVAVLDAMAIVVGAVCSWSCNQIVGCVIVISVLPLLAYYFCKSLICGDEYNGSAKSMNKVFIIVFEGENNTLTIQRLKFFGLWARITHNCYVIVCDMIASDLRDFLYKGNSGIDRVFVVDITNKGWGSYGLKKLVNDWLYKEI